MSIGSPFPESLQTFSLDNPNLTETLFNELMRAIMATQRGVGSGLADHARAWNVEKKDLKTLLDERLKVDAGVITVPHGTLDTAWSATVTFRSPTPFSLDGAVRVFCPDFFLDREGAGGTGMPSACNNIYNITTTGFNYRAESEWHTSGRRVPWLAVEGWDWW